MSEVENVRHLEKVVKEHFPGRPPEVQYEAGWCGGAVSFICGNTRVILRYSPRKRMYYACYDLIYRGQMLMRRGHASHKPFVIFKQIDKWTQYQNKSSRYRRPHSPRL